MLLINPSSLTLRVGEVDDAIILEDVDLLNPRNGVHPQTLQSVLKPLVVGGSGLVDRLLLPVRIKVGQNAFRGSSPDAGLLSRELAERPAVAVSGVTAQRTPQMCRSQPLLRPGEHRRHHSAFPHLRTDPLPPVRTAPAIFSSFSRFMALRKSQRAREKKVIF